MTCPTGKGRFLGKSNYRKTVIKSHNGSCCDQSPSSSKKFFRASLKGFRTSTYWLSLPSQRKRCRLFFKAKGKISRMRGILKNNRRLLRGLQLSITTHPGKLCAVAITKDQARVSTFSPTLGTDH